MMNPALWKLAICAILALGAFSGGYKLRDLSADADVSGLKENAAVAAKISALKYSEEVLANDLLKNYIAAQKIHNQQVVDDARRHLAPVRVLLPAPVCADYGQTDTTPGSEAASPATGVLSADAGIGLAGVQEALDWYVERQKERAEVTEQVMLLCRPVNEWARNQ